MKNPSANSAAASPDRSAQTTLRLRVSAYGTLGLLIFALVRLLHYAWPFAGYDLGYFMPRLIDVHLHYLVNGFSLQWWTPSFGGGLPAFPNPQHTQFMFAQLLLPFTDPWTAVVLSTLLPASLGFLLVVKFGVEELAWSAGPAVVAAVVFTANNFLLVHAFTGHLGFTTFPLVAILPFCFQSKLRAPIAVALFAATGAALIVSGGYAIIIAFCLTAPLVAAGLALTDSRAFPPGRAMRVMVTGTILMTAVAFAKIWAVASFMQRFPRDAGYAHPATHWLVALASVPAQIFVPQPLLFLERLGLVPGDTLFPRWAGSGVEDAGLSPAALGLVPLGLFFWVRTWRAEKILPLAVGLLAAIWLAVEVTLGRGLIWPWLKPLPFFRSLHENSRFASAFILPAALLCGFGTQWLVGWLRSPAIKFLALLALVGVTFLSLLPFRRAMGNLWFGGYDVTATQQTWRQIKSGERFLPVAQIAAVPDEQVFPGRASTSAPYEPIFGYGYPGPQFRSQLQRGPILPDRVGAPLNFHFPPAFYVTDSPRLDPLAPISSARAGELREFLQRKQPDWPRPRFQFAANMITALGLAVILGLLVWGFTRPGSTSVRNPAPA